MSDIATNVVELAVGLGCLAAGVGAWRRSLRWVGALLAVAGLTAAVHAAVALAA